MTALEYFLAELCLDSYPEPITAGHSAITERVFEGIRHLIPSGAKVLDVGCGSGPALALFRKYGFNAEGITPNKTDFAACQFHGFRVHNMMQEQLTFTDECFDLVWARHVLEHSPIPYWVLHEFHRVCGPGGLLYVEVPAPDTACHHETNENHYSCLTFSTWVQLIQRSGFEIFESLKIPLSTPVGPDEYWSYLCRKK